MTKSEYIELLHDDNDAARAWFAQRRVEEWMNDGTAEVARVVCSIMKHGELPWSDMQLAKEASEKGWFDPPPERKKILCVDFDGVLHSYTSGWQGADMIPDPPVPGAIEFLIETIKCFEVHIYSSRSHQSGGIVAMQAWLDWHTAQLHMSRHAPNSERVVTVALSPLVQWPTCKPSAHVSLDARGWQFNGTFPSIDELLAFKPWNKR